MVGEEPEVLRTADGRGAHEADRLAGVHALDGSDLPRVRLDRVGNRVQDPLALGARAARPVVERGVRRTRRAVDIGCAPRRDEPQRRAVHGRVVLEGRTARARDPRITDAVVERFGGELRQEAGGEREVVLEGGGGGGGHSDRVLLSGRRGRG